jgi:hypothetical protein
MSGMQFPLIDACVCLLLTDTEGLSAQARLG